MREFVLTSKKFAGYITFGYNEDGIMIKFLNDAILDETQHTWMRDHMPWVVDEIERFKSKYNTITETTNISFDRFWEDYDYKVGKIQAFKEWQKLSKGDMVKAIVRIKNYRYQCQTRQREMVYPERYLKHKRFNDEDK